MSILKDLYNGKIYPLDAIVPQDKEYRQIGEQIGEMRDYFEEKLPPADREKFAEWNSLIQESAYMEDYANFAYGFRLAMALYMDVLAGDESSEM